MNRYMSIGKVNKYKNLVNVRRCMNEWFKWFKGIDES